MPPSTPRPIDVFEENIADAEVLLKFADGLQTQRTRKLRVERRDKLGRALGMTKDERDAIDGAESDHLFVLLKAGSPFTRDDFTEGALSPLLRQAVVAVSAAIETWVADRAEDFVGRAIRDNPDSLSRVPLDLKTVLEIDARYTRRRWGYREVLVAHIESMASPSPSQIGRVFSMVGRPIKWGVIDSFRGVAKGDSEKDLSALYARRNQIAHSADRTGRSRRAITADEVRGHVTRAREIVEALERHLNQGNDEPRKVQQSAGAGRTTDTSATGG